MNITVILYRQSTHSVDINSTSLFDGHSLVGSALSRTSCMYDFQIHSRRGIQYNSHTEMGAVCVLRYRQLSYRVGRCMTTSSLRRRRRARRPFAIRIWDEIPIRRCLGNERTQLGKLRKCPTTVFLIMETPPSEHRLSLKLGARTDIWIGVWRFYTACLVHL